MNGYSKPRLAVAAVAASAASLGGMAIGAGAAHAATGNTINVGPTGTYKTIQAGLAAAHSGDTVSVAAGTYNEKVSVPAGVHLVSAAAGQAKITGSITLSKATGAVVDGFAITNAGGAAIAVSGDSSGAVISHNTVTGSGASSVTPNPIPVTTPPFSVGSNGTAAVNFNNAGAVAFTGNHVTGSTYHGMFITGATGGETVTGNEFAGNADKNPDTNARYANGLDVKAPNVTVIGNSFHDNQDSGLQFYPAADNGVAVSNVVYANGDHGIDNKDVANGVIVNNTVYGNATAGINVEGTATKFVVENNIASDNGGGGTGRSKGDIRVGQDATVAGNITVDHNLVFESGSNPAYVWDSQGVSGAPVGSGSNAFYTTSSAFHTATGQGAADKTANPAYTAAGTNFHIAATSPAAGLALATAPHAPAKDYDGNASNGSAGAFNAGSTGPTGGGTPPPSGTGPAVSRVAGADRYGTGIALSKKAFPTDHSAPAVVLATGANYPDALAGVPLAKKLGAPLLLVPPTGVNQAVTDEVNRVLKAGGTIYVLGGKVALPDASVAGMTGAKVRYAGIDRYDTAIQIAKQGLGSPKNVVLATGSNFADALAAGPYAADIYSGGNAAILLTAGSVLAPGDADYLKGATSVAAVGGPAVTAAAAGGVHVSDGFKGIDRYETAALIAAKFTSEKTAGVAVSGASNPTQFADALTGAAYLASNGAPLLLVDNNSLPPTSVAALNGIAKAIGTTGTISIFGGPVAISDTVKAGIVTAVGGHAV